MTPPLSNHRSPRILSNLPPGSPLTGAEVKGDAGDVTLIARFELDPDAFVREKGEVKVAVDLRRGFEDAAIELVPLAKLDKGRVTGVLDRDPIGPRGGRDIE